MQVLAQECEWDVLKWNKPTELRLVVAVVYFQQQHRTHYCIIIKLNTTQFAQHNRNTEIVLKLVFERRWREVLYYFFNLVNPTGS